MALNWAMLDADRTPVLLPYETIIRSINSGADVTLTLPEVPPSGNATSGGSGGVRRLKDSGRLWLTNQRVQLFDPISPKTPAIDSLSIPLIALLSTKFQQPLLGGNYLGIDIEPSPGGGLTNGTKAEIRLKDSGLFGFASALDKTREHAIEARQNREDEEGEGLPEYSSTTSSTGAGPSTAPGGVSRPDEPPAYEL